VGGINYMILYFLLLSFPILGAGIKYIDDAFDERKYNKKIAIAIAPVLGILWALTMLVDRVSATVLLAIICGVLFKGKIDNFGHIAGLIVILSITIFAGVEFMILPLIFLAPFALLDEVGNDVIDYNKKYFKKENYCHKFVRYFFDQRWLLKIAVLIFVAVGMMPIYIFFALLFFDGAYLIMRWFNEPKKKGISLVPIIEKRAKVA
jgi:hypothetical protein